MKKILISVAALSLPLPVNASLHDRGNGMIYDDVLDITWLQDANYAQTSAYDDDGLMTWENANTWAANLNYGGYDNWRLPTLNPVNGVEFQVDFSSGRIFDGSQDASYNVGQTGSLSQGFLGSELAYHYYINLGAEATINIDGSFNPTSGIDQASNTANLLLFHNIQTFAYWLALDYENDPNAAWDFFVSDGFQDVTPKGYEFSAWAVHDGDIGQVPLPAAIWLFGFSLLGLFGFNRKLK